MLQCYKIVCYKLRHFSPFLAIYGPRVTYSQHTHNSLIYSAFAHISFAINCDPAGIILGIYIIVCSS